MNNLLHTNPLDPIFIEYESFVDKASGLKTIAFKYFSADIQKAMDYLELHINHEYISNSNPNFSIVETKEYYQPELLH